MDYSPILLFAFKRLDPLMRTVESLQQNSESSESDLFIFVDGPRADRPEEESMVQKVRDYVNSIEGFKSVHCSFPETNRGLGPSIIRGVNSVISEFGRVIVLEDDLILSRNFLSFMNQGLTKYENERKVFSVCGYSNSIKVPADYLSDAYFCTRSSSWGWATWADRWNSVDWELSNWDECRSNRQRFNRWGGSDCFKMLESWREGRNQSWAIRFCYSQFIQDCVSVFPTLSKVANNGFDNNGTNCHYYNRFTCEFDNSADKIFSWPERCTVRQDLCKSALKYHSLFIRLKSRILSLFMQYLTV